MKSSLQKGQAEAAVQYQFTRAITDSMGEGVFALDRDGRLMFLNPAAEEILGYRERQLLGRALHDVIHGCDVLHVIRTGEPYRTDDGVFVRADGSVVPVAYSASPIAVDGQVTGAVVAFHDITVRKQAEASLRFQGQLLDLVQNAVVTTDTRGNITYWNAFAEQLYGFNRDEVLGRAFLHGFLKPWDEARAYFARLLAGEKWTSEWTLRRKDGSLFTALLVGSPITAPSGQVTGTVVVLIDITERKRTEEALREQDRLYRLVAENATDLVILVGSDSTLQYVSPSHETVLGYTQAELHHMELRGVLTELVCPEDTAALAEAIRDALHTKTPGGFAYRIRRKSGEYVWLESVLRPIGDAQGNPTGIQISSRDVTERRAFVEQLTHQAFHDPLTGLPNRALLMDRLEHALTRAQRRTEAVAVLFLDLDRFKVINDSLGHSVGDQLLSAMSERLGACVRVEDTVARLGGDEFTILLEAVNGSNDAILVAERVAESLKAPFQVGGHEVFMTASIGIVVSRPGEYSDSGTLLRDADVAMYRAKAKGKAHYEVFDPTMNTRALERLDLETDLRRAVERGEFRLHYQPIVWLDSGRMSGVEALVRWEHPRLGIVAPDQFIPLAEETGLILPIGRYVLKEACRQLGIWQERYPSDPPLVMSVNLSVRQFQQGGLVEDVRAVLRETGIPPETLQLEITESVMMQDDDQSLEMMQALKAAGAKLAVDDFGTGYSSLSYVKRFPIDILKIDRMFVKGLESAPENTAIVRAVIAFGKALSLQVTGEGVETSEQAAHLLALGCDRGQGYFYSPPVSAGVIEALLIRGDAGRPQY